MIPRTLRSLATPTFLDFRYHRHRHRHHRRHRCRHFIRSTKRNIENLGYYARKRTRHSLLYTPKFSRALYFRDFRGQVRLSKRENKGRKYCASITVITITGSITDFYRSLKRKI